MRKSAVSATNALHASRQRRQNEPRGIAEASIFNAHHPAKQILLSSSRRQKLAHRSSHRFSSQLSGWRTRIAGSKAAKLVHFPHVRKDVLRSASRGPAGAPLEHQDWHEPDDGTKERLTVDRVAYRVRLRAGHFVHDSRPLGSGAHLAAVNGYRSSGDGGEEESRHGSHMPFEITSRDG